MMCVYSTEYTFSTISYKTNCLAWKSYCHTIRINNCVFLYARNTTEQIQFYSWGIFPGEMYEYHILQAVDPTNTYTNKYIYIYLHIVEYTSVCMCSRTGVDYVAEVSVYMCKNELKRKRFTYLHVSRLWLFRQM